MNRIEFNCLLDYVVCPYKSTLSVDNYYSLDSVYKEVATFLFARSILDITVTYNKLHKHFNKCWDSFRSEHPDYKPTVSELTLVAKRIKALHELLPSAGKVIAFDYPLFFSDKDILVNHKIDAVIYDYLLKEVSFVFLISSQTNMFVSAVEELLYSSYIYSALSQTEMPFKTYKVVLYDLRLGKFIYLKRQNLVIHKKLIKAYLSAYNQTAHYPLPYKSTCNLCKFKNACEYKI